MSAAAAGDARQRPGAGQAETVAAALGGAEVVAGEDRRRRGRRQGALRPRGRAGDPRRRGRARRALGQGPARRAARRPRAGRRPRPRGPERRLHRRRRLARRARRGRAGRDREPAPRARSCSPCAPTSRSPSCAATSTRGWRSSPTAATTGSCSPPPGSRGSGARDEISFRFELEQLTPAPGQGCLALEARDDDAETAAAAGRITDRAALIELTAERAAVRALEASCDTPVGVCARLEGDELVLRRLRRACPTAASGSATGSPATPSSRRRSARRWPSGCSPRARARSSQRAEAMAMSARAGRRLPGRRRARRPGADDGARARAARERRRRSSTTG